MPLLEKNAFTTDTWTFIAAEQALADGGRVALAFARLKAEWETLARFPGELGAVLSNTDNDDEVEVFLPHLSLVVLPFPAFADGRSYSIARQIRNRGYKGELRASGNVLPDQLQMMLQVGFSSFDVSDRFPLQAWQAAAKQMSLAYQRGLYRRASEIEVWSERHHEAAAWEEKPNAR